MTFCTNCGSKQQEGLQVCKECGEALPAAKTQASPQRTKKIGPSKKQRIQLIAVIGTIILLFSIFKIGETLANGTRTLENFREAIAEKNVDEVSQYLSLRDSDTTLSEKHAEDLIAYYHDEVSAMNDLNNFLDEKSNLISRGSNPAIATEYFYPGIDSLSFERTGSKWLFYDNYEFIVDPFEIHVQSNQTDVAFSVDGKIVEHEVLSDGLYNLGDFTPGVYEVAAELDSNFVQLETKAKKHHFYTETISMNFDVDEIELKANVDDATLFINEEDTGLTVGTEAEYIGPVLLDGSMDFHIEKEAPFGLVSSPKVAAEDYFMELSLEANEEILLEVKEDLSETLKGEGFRQLQSNTDTVEFLESIEIYTGSSYIENTGSQWKIWLNVKEHWQEDTSWSDEDVDMTPYERDRNYEFLFNTSSENWVFQHSESTYATLEGPFETITFDYEDQLNTLISQKESDAMDAHRENEEDNLSYLFNYFISANVYGINSGDTEDVVSYIDPDAPDYINTVVDYADSLYDRNISQSFQGVEILDYSSSDNEHYKVTTFEDYIIYYDDDDEVKRKTFESQYNVRLTTEGFKVVELLETTEQSSKDW